MREHARSLSHFSELPVKILNGVGSVDHSSNRLRITKERSDLSPPRFPAFEISFVLRPQVHDIFECISASLLTRSGVDGLEILTETLPVFVWQEHDGVSDLMSYADLNIC